jgi:hypothetical protein
MSSSPTALWNLQVQERTAIMEYLARRPGEGRGWAGDMIRLPTMRQLQGCDPVQVEAFLQHQIQVLRHDLTGRFYDDARYCPMLAKLVRAAARLREYENWLHQQEKAE